MDVNREEKGGKVILSFSMSADEYKEFLKDVDESEKSELAAPMLARKQYCCWCHGDASGHTISASHSVSAAAKCFKDCGTFQLTKGACS